MLVSKFELWTLRLVLFNFDVLQFINRFVKRESNDELIGIL
jgi:hypothetical protein